MSNEVKINLNKTSTLKFENNIVGTDSKPTSFFSIPIDENLSLTIKGNDISEDGKLITEISIPPLKDFYNKSQTIKEANLNIKVSKSLFTPWKGDVVLEMPMEVETCLKETIETKDIEPEVKLESVQVTQEETITETNNTSAKKKGKFSAKKFKSDY